MKASDPAAETASAEIKGEEFLPGVMKYVKSHLMVINNVALTAGTIVGLLDFFCPVIHVLPTVAYSITGFVLVVLLIAGARPERFGKLLCAVGFPLEQGNAPAWKYAGFQMTIAFLFAVTAIGWLTVAKASQGGVLAAAFPDARRLQVSLLHLENDVGEIKAGVREANGKLDLLVADSKDPQKELSARGYSFYSSGLAHAIQQGDKHAVALFVKAGLRFDNENVLNNLLRQDVAWDADIASFMTRSMFSGSQSCRAGSFFAGGWTTDHIPERVALFKRLCDGDDMVARLKQLVTSDSHAGPPPNAVWADYRKYRKIYLEEFTKG